MKVLITSDSDENKKVIVNCVRDGLSAYELAVKNGYEGSEEDFMNNFLENKYIDFKAHYILSKN